MAIICSARKKKASAEQFLMMCISWRVPGSSGETLYKDNMMRLNGERNT